MSALSFCIDCINHDKIPLEAIAKFFYGERVGIVSWIDITEYIEVEICGAVSLDNYRRLYVHFENTHVLERSETIHTRNKKWK